jgi:hypothetical protein
MPISRQDVRHGFRFILGREPENELVYLKYMLFPNLEKFRAHLFRSDEFRGKSKGDDLEISAYPAASHDREVTVFIHLQKVGGMTFHSLLSRNFEHDRICQVRENKLHLLSLAELGWYDLFSGHFDHAAVDFIPKRKIRKVAFFREPRARLISFYRFVKSHPPRDEFANSRSVQLANQLSPEEFFEHEEIRAAPEVFNHYLLTFGLSSYAVQQAGPRCADLITPEIVERAKQNIGNLTGIGLTEKFKESAGLIFNQLGFRMPMWIESKHVTDRLPNVDGRFSKVEPVAMTPRLNAALDELVRYDNELYHMAVAEYEKRSVAAVVF